MAGGTFSDVDALVMKGDTITYTGTIEGAQEVAEPGADTVDRQGRCVLPGFIEPHLYLILTALADNYLYHRHTWTLRAETVSSGAAVGQYLPRTDQYEAAFASLAPLPLALAT